MSLFKFKSDNADKKWNDETDYTAEINATSDPAKKAELERLRNDKIDRLGLPYEITFNHNDVGTMMKHGMENGASGADMMKLDDYRINKALTTPGLENFAYDEIHDAATRYYYNDLMGVGGNYQNRPVYENKYGDFVDKMWDRVMNGEEFSYDVESDPNYQVYKDMYTREGNRAMQDTLAQVAQNAGGNNSYAVSAAAQANNYYMQQLADKVPELYNAAYNRYMNEENLKRQDLEIARMLESDDYNRYLGDMGVFQTNVGLANNMINSQLDREYQERAWDYNVDRNAILDERYKDETAYGREQDAKNWAWMEDEKGYNRGETAKAQAKDDVWTMANMGVMPPDKLLEEAGLLDQKAEIQQMANKANTMWNSQYS